MVKNFHESFSEAPIELPTDRSTGLVFAAVAAIVAVFYRTNMTVFTTALAVAAALVAVSLFVPWILRPLNIVWFKFAMLLSKVMNPIVMLVLFSITIVPFGLAMQLRYDPLRRKKKPEASSYWIMRNKNGSPISMKNQF